MSYENVKSYFESIGLEDHITVHETTGDTVAHAAMTLGCSEAEIAKTLSFMVDEKPVLVVMAGDTRTNSSKFKKYFHTKPHMVPRDLVDELIGHAPGGVCPFAIKENVPVYLDESLKRFQHVHTAAGIDNATICLTIPELEQHSGYLGWVDIGKITEAEAATKEQ